MVVFVVDVHSTLMLPLVRGLLMPLSTLMLLASVAPLEPPSTLIPAVTFLYTLLEVTRLFAAPRRSIPWSPLSCVMLFTTRLLLEFDFSSIPESSLWWVTFEVSVLSGEFQRRMPE